MSLASSQKCSSAVTVLFLLLAFFRESLVSCSVDATAEDEPPVGVDLLFLAGGETGMSWMGVRMVLRMGSNKCVTMCFKSSSSCS